MRAMLSCRRESQLFTLLDPVQGNVMTQLLKVQVVWLTTLQYRFDNIGREERARENLPHVTFRQPGLSGQRSPIEGISLKNSFVPAVRSCYGLYQ